MSSFSRASHRIELIRPAALVLLVVAIASAGCGSPEAGKASTRAAYQFVGFIDEAEQLVSVAAGGDVNFGDGVTPTITAGGPDYPWEDAAAVFEKADLGFVNLECCLATGGSPVAGKEFTFRGPPEAAAGMADAGVSVVSLANNHSKDYGTPAFLETLENLEESGVAWCGAGKDAAEAYSPRVLETHGRKVAFVAFTWVVPEGWPATASSPGCATTYDSERVAETIRNARSGADYVVASFHWGIELATSPNSEQRTLARLAVDSGADLVLGHHPHVVQGFEVYKDRLIAYSLGNFIFSPPREISARTLTVTALLGPDGLIQARVVPMVISGCRPVILNGAAAETWMGTVADYSSEFDTRFVIRDGRGYIEPAEGTTAE